MSNEPQSVSDRTRERMARLGIPAGTDDPTLLALGAEPLPTTPRTPITRQRSPWVERRTETIGGVPTTYHHRLVGDGSLWAMVAEEPQGWHLSISFRDKRNTLTRYPRWDEIAHARDELLPADVDFVMWLPKTSEYVALHDTTFHLHEQPERNG